MNREIKFRGQNRLGRFVYGIPLLFDTNKNSENVTIVSRYIAEDGAEHQEEWIVQRKTIGQYTGLKDKNGKEVYDGDILKTPRGFIGKVVFGRAEEECRHKVFGRMVIDVYTTYGWIFMRGDGYRCAIDDELLEGEIVGNIHGGTEDQIEWHATCDIPAIGKRCLVVYEADGEILSRIDWRNEYEWVEACHYDKILRWAYIEIMEEVGYITKDDFIL